MKTLRHITIALFFIIHSGGLFAQQDSSHYEGDSLRQAKIGELKKLRRQLFVQKLELTTEQADKFFPVFDEYQWKQREAKKEFRKKWKGKKIEDLTEEESKLYLVDAIKAREKEVELFKLYTEKLKTILPAKKLVLLPQIEKEVQRELMRKAREGKNGKNGPHRGRKMHGPR